MELKNAGLVYQTNIFVSNVASNIIQSGHDEIQMTLGKNQLISLKILEGCRGFFLDLFENS